MCSDPYRLQSCLDTEIRPGCQVRTAIQQARGRSTTGRCLCMPGEIIGSSGGSRGGWFVGVSPACNLTPHDRLHVLANMSDVLHSP